jgi:predicted transcriptional regulator
MENPGKFDLELEKLVIDHCIEITKNKFFHCYKLQTAINSIKLSCNKIENFDFNFLGLPMHCINLMNIDCNFTLSEKFAKIIEEEKPKTKIPSIAKFMYQLGNVEFCIKTKRVCEKGAKQIKEIFNFKANFIQYEIFNFIAISKKEISLAQIIEKFNLKADFAEFLIEGLLNYDLLIEKDKDSDKIFFYNKNFFVDQKKLINEYKENKGILSNFIEKSIFKEFKEINKLEENDIFQADTDNKHISHILVDKKDKIIFLFEKSKEELRYENRNNSEAEIKEYFFDIQFNIVDYLKRKNNNVDSDYKNMDNILDCYLVKVCKQYKKRSYEQIIQFLTSLNNKLIGEINEERISNRINNLVDKLIIKKLENNFFEYA